MYNRNDQLKDLQDNLLSDQLADNDPSSGTRSAYISADFLNNEGHMIPTQSNRSLSITFDRSDAKSFEFYRDGRWKFAEFQMARSKA